GFFDPLDGANHNFWTGDMFVSRSSQALGGFVQHVRPSVADCIPKPIPPVKKDANFYDQTTGAPVNSGFRRSVAERAGPPYIGRGLIEAIPTADLTAGADPTDMVGSNSSLGHYAAAMGCNPTGDCVAGKINIIPRSFTALTTNGQTEARGAVGGQGR